MRLAQPKINVTHAQSLKAALILREMCLTEKIHKIALKLGMIQPYVYLARGYPYGSGQRCPGWAVLKILDSEQSP